MNRWTRFCAICFFASAIGCKSQIYRLIFEGDSNSQINGAPGMVNIFASQMTNAYWLCTNIASGIQVAISGSKIKPHCDNRYTNNVFPYRTAGGTTAVLFVECGINDISDAPSALSIFENYSNYCVRAVNDGFVVVAFTPGSSTNHSVSVATLKTNYCTLMRTHWPAFSSWLIDVQALIPDAADQTYYYSDGIHWNTNGHNLVASHIDLTMGLCGLKRPTRISIGKARGLP